jgi:hypothetical protein
LGDVPATNGATPTLAISPRGGVWLWHADRVWGRYDAKADRFVRGDPCDDFAFALGSQQLSAIPATGEARCGRLFRKRSDNWEPMPNPFGPGELGVTPRCARAGRLLVTCWQGAFEYDPAGDEWVCLHGGRDLAAWFDAAGRRVLATTDPVGQLFVYEGDPFAARPPPDTAVAVRFGQLLQQMDDASYQVRTKATQEVFALGEPSAGLIRATLRRADLPAEVRDRLESALRDLNVMERLPRTNLFSQMHPPLAPPK